MLRTATYFCNDAFFEKSASQDFNGVGNVLFALLSRLIELVAQFGISCRLKIFKCQIF